MSDGQSEAMERLELISGELTRLGEQYRRAGEIRRKIEARFDQREQEIIEILRREKIDRIQVGNVHMEISEEIVIRMSRQTDQAKEVGMKWLTKNAPEQIDRTPRLPHWKSEVKFWNEWMSSGKKLPIFVQPQKKRSVNFKGTMPNKPEKKY